MKTAKTLIAALAVMMATLTACAPLSGKNPIPEPSADHGPEASMACKEPYVTVSVTVLDKNSAYAARRVVIAISAVDADGDPVTFKDYKTGEQTQWRWSKAVATSLYRDYDVCVDGWAPNTVPYMLVTATLTAVGGDSIHIQVLRPNGDLIMPRENRFGEDIADFAVLEEDEPAGGLTVSAVIPLI